MDKHIIASTKYEVILDKSELFEFCLYAIWDRTKQRKYVWILLIFTIVVDSFIIPEAALVLGVVIPIAIVLSIVVNYKMFQKMLWNQKWVIWVENGLVKDTRENYSEVPCNRIQFFYRTHRLQMFGFMRSAQQIAWYVIPLRMFHNEQERQQFIDQLQHSQMTEQETEIIPEQEILHFSYILNQEKWVKFSRSVADAVNSGVLGRIEYLKMIIICYVVFASILTVCVHFAKGRLNWVFVLYVFFLALLMTAGLFFRNPEKLLKKQAQFAVKNGNLNGLYQIFLLEKGVIEYLPMGAKNFLTWEMLGWIVETPEAFLLIQRDRKRSVAIAKECFQDWNQVFILQQLCARKGLQAVQEKRMHYLPDWGFALGVVLFVVLIFASSLWSRTQQSIKRAQNRLIPYEKEQFNPSDYPNYVSLDEQVEVLESLGIEGARQAAVSIQEWMDEYHMQAQIEGEPYCRLLMELGMPFYNEEGVILNYPTEVFSFDFEGYDISTDYIEILNGMLALAEGSCLDSVSNIREDTTKVNWEQGDGKITLYLEWNGQEYTWDMDVYYDWIDSKVIGVLNVLLLEEGTQKLFYMTGDNGQGAIIFFCTPEWAETFSEKTGLELWHYEAWTDAQKEYVKDTLREMTS